jgi:hypothetical protein
VSRGQHAADDGSFQRSAGGAMVRGIALIVAAVVLGVVLLRATDSPAPTSISATSTDTASTTPSSVANDGSTTVPSTPTTTKAAAHTASDVQVLVANGSGVAGAAGRVATKLGSKNYVIKPSVNTATTASASAVYYQPGYQADAEAIAALLTPKPGVQPMPDPAPVKDLTGAHVLVVVAANLAAGG